MNETINDDTELDLHEGDSRDCEMCNPSTSHLDDRVLDARDMQAEIDEAYEGRPPTYLTAAQARALPLPMSSDFVFSLIKSAATSGYSELFVTYDRLAPETLSLLGAGGYRVRRGGVANDQAVISWAESND